MLRNTLIVTSVLALAGSSQAAVNITQSSVPTVDLAGFHTYTLTASTDDGSQIQGFDFASQPSFGFFGPMKQINPAGLPTVFDDCCFFGFIDFDTVRRQDSYFKFLTSQLTIPAGFSSESATSLRSVFASGTPLGTSVPFVQLVIPDAAAAQVAYTGQVQTVVGSTVTDNNVAGVVPVPEPTTVILLGLAAIGGCGFIRRGRGLAHKAVALPSVLAVLAVAASSPAAVIVNSFGVPTIGLPGYTTYTLTATTDNGSQIQGFDFASVPAYGFFGPMNQLHPAGLPTIFQDNNAFFPFFSNYDISQDSQFKFLSSNVTIPAGFASESATSLRAVFAAPAPLGTSVPFVQLAMPSTGSSFQYVGQIQTVPAGGGPPSDNTVVGSLCLACYPPQITDVFVDNVNADIPGFVNRTISTSPLGGTFSNFRFDSYVPALGVIGSGPAVPATFDSPTRNFNWSTIGSPLGTYKWLVTATNTYGLDDGSITVRITAVPEPTTLGLVALAVFAAHTCRRR